MSAAVLSFAHVGINCDSESLAREAAELLGRLFGVNIRDGSSSVFAGSEIEITKRPFRGTHGHLAFRTPDIEGSIQQLADMGIATVQGSEKYKGEKLVAVYLDLDVAGFAVHLLAAQ